MAMRPHRSRSCDRRSSAGDGFSGEEAVSLLSGRRHRQVGQSGNKCELLALGRHRSFRVVGTFPGDGICPERKVVIGNFTDVSLRFLIFCSCQIIYRQGATTIVEKSLRHIPLQSEVLVKIRLNLLQEGEQFGEQSGRKCHLPLGSAKIFPTFD